MDKLAVIQSTETVAELKEIDTKTKELVATFHSLVEITDKINYGFGKGTPKEYIKAINEAAAIQKKYEQALRDVAKAQSEVERLQKKIEFAMTSEGKQVASLKLQLADLNRENKETAKSTSALSSAYDDLNRRHEVARKKAMDLGVTHGIVSKEFLEAAAKANQYEQELKRIDVTLGKFNRNVGNYHGNMFGLNAQMAQVLREMPNFAIDPRIGIMSLTNNLPYLADAIADVSRESKALKTEYLASAAAAREKAVADALAEGASRKHAAALGAQAEAQVMSNYQAVKAPGIMKQIISSIFSWQSLLIVGISLLMMYNKEIIAWTKSIFSGAKAVDKLAESQKYLSEAIKDADYKKAVRDVSEMANTFALARDGVISKEKALKFYNETLGKVMWSAKSLDEAEQILTKNADNYIKATLYKAAANLALNKAAEEALKAEESRRKKLEEFDNAFNDATISQIRTKEQYELEQKRIAKARQKRQEDEIKAAKDAQKAQQDIAKDLMKTAAQFAKGLNFDSTLGLKNDPKPKADKKYTGSKLSGEEKDAIDLAIADLDNQIAKIKEQKINLEITEKEYWESYIKIQLKYRDRILNILNEDNAKKKRISANTRKKAMDELEKANKEIFDYTKKGMDAQRKLEMQELENKMEAIKNDEYILEVERINQQNAVYNRMLDVTNNHYQELIEAAKKTAQEIINIEAERDAKILEIQKNQMGLNANLPKATKSDVEYYQKIEDAYKSAADAEERLNIIANSRLNKREREFLLSLKEAEQTLENLEKDKLRLQEREKELRQKAESNKLTINESEELGNIVDKVSEINEKLEKTRRNTDEIKLNKLREDWDSTLSVIKSGFEDLGFSNLASVVDRTFDEIIGKTFDWKDASILAATAVVDALTTLNQTALNNRIAALDEELKVSEERTNQEIGFIEQRLEWLNNLDNATKEQIDERNALEDEARVLKEQQLQREKMIAIQKARAEQRAAANQAMINGLVGAAKSIPNWAQVAASIAAGAVFAGLIMAKDPTPKYFVGRKGGPEEWAWTQEKGREIITDKDGNVKSLGSDKGATLTKLAKGDNVYTAEETQKMLSDLGGISLDSNVFHKIARQGVSPIIIKDKEIDYDKFAGKVGEEFDRTMRKYDKTSFFEDEKGNVFSQDGGKIPVFRGRKKSNIIIINSGKNERN